MAPRRAVAFSRRANIGVAVLSSVIALFCAVFAVIMLSVGPYYVLAMQAVVATLVGVGSAVRLIKLRPYVAPRTQCDGTGTTFRPDRGLDVGSQLVVYGIVVNWVFFAYTFLVLIGDWPSVNGWPVLAPALFAVALGALFVWRYLRRGASRYLRLTPWGIELGHWRRRSCHWAEIRDVPGVADIMGAVSLWRALRPNDVIVLTDTTSLRLPAGAFLFNGAALRDLVEFYWRHPEDRDELVDGRAPARLAAPSNLRPRH